MSGVLVDARGLTKTYDRGRVRALDGVDFRLERGEMVSIVGPSGSGKSTLLHVIGALDRPDSGDVSIDGVDLARAPRLDHVRADKVGFVFQLHNLVPSLSARENVELPMFARRPPPGRGARRARAEELLALVGLADRGTHLPTEMSGGQRQRVAVARALANDPPLLLADEPTGNLDQESGARVLELLEALRRERGVAVVLVTHDRDLAARADRIVRILDGRVVDRGAGG
jgi:ABC-type lipoprotein export system ATPase subunit